MLLLLRLVWSISVRVVTVASNVCDWCSDYYTEHYWYHEVVKNTGKIFWCAEKLGG